MSAVDAPPGLDFGGPAVGEFLGRKRPRNLARITFLLCLIDGAITYSLASKQLHAPGTSTLFVGPIMCLSIAAVGLAIRSARVRVDGDGLRWGWNLLGGRVARDQIVEVKVYSSGLTIWGQAKARLWYLSRYDWEAFDAIPKAFVDAGMQVEMRSGVAPLRDRLKAYGIFLDGLMVVTLLMSASLLLFAALR